MSKNVDHPKVSFIITTKTGPKIKFVSGKFWYLEPGSGKQRGSTGTLFYRRGRVMEPEVGDLFLFKHGTQFLTPSHLLTESYIKRRDLTPS